MRLPLDRRLGVRQDYFGMQMLLGGVLQLKFLLLQLTFSRRVISLLYFEIDYQMFYMDWKRDFLVLRGKFVRIREKEFSCLRWKSLERRINAIFCSGFTFSYTLTALLFFLFFINFILKNPSLSLFCILISRTLSITSTRLCAVILIISLLDLSPSCPSKILDTSKSTSLMFWNTQFSLRQVSFIIRFWNRLLCTIEQRSALCLGVGWGGWVREMVDQLEESYLMYCRVESFGSMGRKFFIL